MSLFIIRWIEKKMKSREKIIKEEDFDKLFSLADNSDFSITLQEIFLNRYTKNSNSLNDKQLNLFLCMQLENAGQANGILSFLQENFQEKQKKVVQSLNEIGALKSAKIIEKAISLLPNDGSWFLSSANNKDEKLMEKLDKDFSNYPDGKMFDLYRKYAEKHKSEISKF